MKKIILASSSPRRRELLTKITKDFEIVTPTFDESKFSLSTNPISIENLSLSKAKSISIKLTISALVISADTVVIYGDRIMGKPKSREEAYDMIKTLSGKTHHVITGVAVVDAESENYKMSHDTTFVTFNELSDKDIYGYIDDKKPYDKAGAYGIQGIGSMLIKKIDGAFYNVVGLPVSEIAANLEGFLKTM